MGARTKGRNVSLTGVLLLVCCTVSVVSKGKNCGWVSVSPGWKRPSRGALVVAHHLPCFWEKICICLVLFSLPVCSSGFCFMLGLLELCRSITSKFPTLSHGFHIALKSMLIVPLSLAVCNESITASALRSGAQTRLCNRHVSAFSPGVTVLRCERPSSLGNDPRCFELDTL